MPQNALRDFAKFGFGFEAGGWGWGGGEGGVAGDDDDMVTQTNISTRAVLLGNYSIFVMSGMMIDDDG